MIYHAIIDGYYVLSRNLRHVILIHFAYLRRAGISRIFTYLHVSSRIFTYLHVSSHARKGASPAPWAAPTPSPAPCASDFRIFYPSQILWEILRSTSFYHLPISSPPKSWHNLGGFRGVLPGFVATCEAPTLRGWKVICSGNVVLEYRQQRVWKHDETCRNMRKIHQNMAAWIASGATWEKGGKGDWNSPAWVRNPGLLFKIILQCGAPVR